MKSTKLQIGIWALILLAFTAVANAQVCNGTVSAPTEEVYVDANFNISFFNAEGASTGSNITLNLPPQISIISGPNPVIGISNFTTYQWVVAANESGSYTFNVTMEGSVNCSLQGETTIVEDVPAPLIWPSIGITTSGPLTKNNAYTVQLNLTNLGGLARNVDGSLTTASGSTITPVSFSYLTITNVTPVTSLYTMTPGYCGSDSVTAYITNVQDDNGYDSPIVIPYAQKIFAVQGSDNAFTTIGAETPVAQGDLATFSYTVQNLPTGSIDATGVTVTILVDGSTVHTDTIPGTFVVNASSSQTYDFNTASTALGTHTITFRVDSTSECSSDNNEIDTTFNVGSSSLPVCGNSIIESGEACDSANLNSQTCATLGLGFTGGTLSCAPVTCAFVTTACTTTASVCGDAVCDGGETTATCPSDCPAAPTTGGSGGGGSGGGSGGGNLGKKIYILELTPEHPTKTLSLRNGDTVQYYPEGGDYSFVFRQIDLSKTVMGIAKAEGYQSYNFYTGTSYDLNLDNRSGSDLGIKADKTYIGYGNYTFTLLGIESKKSLFVLPFLNKKPRTQTANTSTDIAAEPEQEEQESEIFAEGMLNFVENLTARNSAPIWSGIGIAALILLVGLGSYFIITRKGSDEDAQVTVKEAKEEPLRLPETRIKVGKRK